jgi:hypothetical protein
MRKAVATPLAQQIIYVDQGQCVISTDPNVTLITTGMTECIGIAFLADGKPPIKALAHLDGHCLNDIETALQNLQKVRSAIKSFGRYHDIKLIAFGGRVEGHNFPILQQAVKEVFGKAKLEYHPYDPKSKEEMCPMDLTITDNGSFGKFEHVRMQLAIKLSQTEVEDLSLSTQPTHKNDLKVITHQSQGKNTSR